MSIGLFVGCQQVSKFFVVGTNECDVMNAMQCNFLYNNVKNIALHCIHFINNFETRWQRTDGPTNGPTNRPTDIVTYRAAIAANNNDSFSSYEDPKT